MKQQRMKENWRTPGRDIEREHPRTNGVQTYSAEQYLQKKGVRQPRKVRDRRACDAAERHTCNNAEREVQASEHTHREHQQMPGSNEGGAGATSILNRTDANEFQQSEKIPSEVQMSDMKPSDTILHDQSSEIIKNPQWMGDMLSELGHITTPRDASLIYNDNEGNVQVLSTGNFSTDSRHMRLRFHHLVDCVAKQQLSIQHISTGDMWADGLTKPLGGNKHREFLQVLGMKDGTIGGMVDGTVAGGVLGREA
jgi:hypothetical protein